jgi:hypothetical protein
MNVAVDMPELLPFVKRVNSGRKLFSEPRAGA